MADSNALRSRRKRLHAAGDHSLCRRGCGERRGAPLIVGVVPVEGQAGNGVADFDLRTSLEGLAKRLEAAHEADPADAAVARELRATLLALRGPGEQADSELAGFLAEFSRA